MRGICVSVCVSSNLYSIRLVSVILLQRFARYSSTKVQKFLYRCMGCKRKNEDFGISVSHIIKYMALS